MPADTPTKRYSAANVGCPWRSVLPLPDGTIDQGDRQVVGFMYSGILAGSEVPILQRSPQANWGSWRRSWTL